MKKYIIGIDIGGRSLKFGLFTTDGELVNKSTIITVTENDGEAILPDAVEHLKKIIEKFNLNKSNLLGIGVGVPGPILEKRIVNGTANLGWSGKVYLADYIEEKLGYKVLVENDANVAALGELWGGAAKDFKNAVMVTLGTGVGGGIIVDGKIVSGTHGAGGEIGHIPLLEEPLKRTCGCGGHRCLEQVASATGIEYLAQDYLFENDGESSLRKYDFVGAKAIFDEAKKKDRIALEIVDKYTNYLGRGLAIIGAIVDPQIFIIGGGVSNAGDFLLKRLEKSYNSHAFSAIKEVEFKIAELGNDAGIFGAANLILTDK